jgi:MFS family permease
LSVFRALGQPNFRIFFIGQTISLTGTWMQNVAQAWLVYRLTHSELLLGTTAFLSHISTLLLGPFAGVVADRFERRRIVVICQSLFFLQALTLAILTILGKVTVTHVLTLAAFQGIVDAFDRPARQAMLIQLASREHLHNAISLNSLMYNTARVVGPSMGGMMVAAFGEGPCFALNAASFLAVIGGLLLVKIEREEPNRTAGAMSHLAEGFRYVQRNPATSSPLLLVALVNLATAPVWALLPVFADAIFHKGSEGVGFLTASMGLGAVLGMLHLASLTTADGLHRVAFWNALILAVALIGFAWSTIYMVSSVLMALLGASVMRVNGATNTEIQTQVPEDMRGRIMGFFAAANVGVIPIGSLGGGIMAQAVGVRWTVFAGGMICLLAALLFQSRRGTT